MLPTNHAEICICPPSDSLLETQLQIECRLSILCNSPIHVKAHCGPFSIAMRRADPLMNLYNLISLGGYKICTTYYLPLPAINLSCRPIRSRSITITSDLEQQTQRENGKSSESSSGSVTRMTGTSSNTPPPEESVPITYTQPRSSGVQYLPICLGSGQISLYHIQIHPNDDDEVLFSRIRDVYAARYGLLRRAFSVYQIRRIEHIKVQRDIWILMLILVPSALGRSS